LLKTDRGNEDTVVVVVGWRVYIGEHTGELVRGLSASVNKRN